MITIDNIHDILPHIEGRPEFKHKVCDGYSYIDYVYSDRDTFANEYLMECRGIKFSPEGHVIARPFHKFFNLGERKDLEEGRDFNEAEMFMKLDGSLIHPFLIQRDGELQLRLATKAGVTEVSRLAEELTGFHKDEKLRARLQHTLSCFITPMFEFTSPHNQIVVPYEESRLTLIGARCTYTGEYLNYEELVNLASWFELPVVQRVEATLDEVRSWPADEGVILVWPDGYRLKLKADRYVELHGFISNLGSERRIVQSILNGNIDDCIPLLPSERVDEIEKFSKSLHSNILREVENIKALYEKSKNMERKDVAQSEGMKALNCPHIIWSLIGGRFDEDRIFDEVKTTILIHCNTPTRFSRVEWCIEGV